MRFGLILFLQFYTVFALCPLNFVNGITSDACDRCGNSRKFMDAKICVISCPSQSTEQSYCLFLGSYLGRRCTIPSVALFTLSFSSVQDLSLNTISPFSTPSNIAFSSTSKVAPLPTLDRGFYFESTSSLASTTSFIPAMYFTGKLWIRSLANGEILNARMSSKSYIRFYSSGGLYKYDTIVTDSNNNYAEVTVSVTSPAYSATWQQIMFQHNQVDCQTVTTHIFIDGVATTVSTLKREAGFPSGTYSWTIGNWNANNGFRAFVWWMEVRNDLEATFVTFANRYLCNNNFYWSGSSCQQCDASCPNWPWCVRGTDCRICFRVECTTCSGYSDGMCSACSTGVPTRCCDTLATACTATWTGTTCSTAIAVLNGVCMRACPYGFGSCAVSAGLLLNINLSGSFVGSYSVFITGTSSANYQPFTSPEILLDPIPVKNRGLYFYSGRYLSAPLQLHHTCTIGLWAYPMTGDMIGDSTSRFKISASGIFTFVLERFDATLGTYTVSHTITLNSWQYISVSVSWSGSSTTITPYVNNIVGTATSVTNYVFRPTASTFVHLGKSESASFTGYISYFQLWGSAQTSFTTQMNLFCTGGSTCWSCGFLEFFDGSSYQACGSACTILGCVRSTSCNICSDILCAICTSFDSGTCTQCIADTTGALNPCACASGFIAVPNQSLCGKDCYLGCSDCSGGNYFYQCTVCYTNYYLLNNFCLTVCPEGYIQNAGTKTCDYTTNASLSMNFNDHIKISSLNGLIVGSDGTSEYPNFDTNDPTPAISRGYYFTGTSQIYKTGVVVSPWFTISFWIYLMDDGVFFQKFSSPNSYITISFASYFLDISLSLKTSKTLAKTDTTNLQNSWKYIALTLEYLTGNPSLRIYINNLEMSITSQTYCFLEDLGNLYIGQNSGGFKGYLWTFMIYNQNTHRSAEWSSTCSGCTNCASNGICPDNCGINAFRDGGSCTLCKSGCSRGCRNTDTCRLCKKKECLTCDSFSGNCLTCIPNAINDGLGGCTCEASSPWEFISETCDSCDILCVTCVGSIHFECSFCETGSELLGSVCLKACPTGYTSSCTLISDPVIDVNFETSFNGNYDDFITASDGTKFEFFNDAEPEDPIPALKRGLYFTGSKYLETASTYYLSHSCSVGMWIYVITNGELFQKISKIKLNSDGELTVTLDTKSETTSAFVVPAPTAFSDWVYLSVTIKYLNSNTDLYVYVNNAQQGLTVTKTNYLFRDGSSDIILLGKHSLNSFTGFIYEITIWNTNQHDFSSSLMYPVCTTPIMANCLMQCGINSVFSEGSCVSCNECTKGCVRTTDCNICNDKLCEICLDFSTTPCDHCVSNANDLVGHCTCDTGYTESTDELSCVPCFSGCSACSGPGYQECTICDTGTYKLDYFCLESCPIGYTPDTDPCVYVSNIIWTFDLLDILLLDVYNGFTIGSNDTNINPNFDTNDPIPAIRRGYYFESTKYMTGENIMVSPSFTFVMWIRAKHEGAVFLKYHADHMLKLEINSSGMPIMSLKMSDDSLFQVTGSYILDSWKYLAFTLEAKSDGCNLFTSYINNNFITTETLCNLGFIDITTGSIIIGTDDTYTNGFWGFIARISIYNTHNLQASDYKTTLCDSTCAYCPASSYCLSSCEIDQYPEDCGDCDSSCSYGCKDNESCSLCKNNECFECTGYTTDCSSCVNNADITNNDCQCGLGYAWSIDSYTCEACSPNCEDCSDLSYSSCTACDSSHYLIQDLCVSQCPSGYNSTGQTCEMGSDGLVFNLKLLKIQDVVYDLKSNIPVVTGNNSQFYPNYGTHDPYPAIHRGYYFNGNSFMSLPPNYYDSTILLTLSPKFVFTTWIKPQSDGVIFIKENSALEAQILIKLSSGFAIFGIKLNDDTFKVLIADESLTNNQWNFISATSDINSSPSQYLQLNVNGVTKTSNDLSESWFEDILDYTATIGARFNSPTTLEEYYTGFIWDIKIYNTIPPSDLVETTCDRCLKCPIDNDNKCLPNCGILEYPDGDICKPCKSNCINGCVRDDDFCNLCADLLCEVCDDFSEICLTCIDNAELDPSDCDCDTGYVWNVQNNYCMPCSAPCNVCTQNDLYHCVDCIVGYSLFNSHICLATCPLGYKSIANICVLESPCIFDLNLNTLNGVIYDAANKIPVVTGSTDNFYGNFDTDDPIPAYHRGLYFNGFSSVLNLPEFGVYTAPKLIIAPIFTFTLWLSPSLGNSVIFLKKSYLNSNYLVASLYNFYPRITVMIEPNIYELTCSIPASYQRWSHVTFTVNLDYDISTINCFVNTYQDQNELTASGYFKDLESNMKVMIGSDEVSSYYTGFIYQIQIYNNLQTITNLASIDCTENCQVCLLDGSCIPYCPIEKLWQGPEYQDCADCKSTCNSCRYKSSCNLCNSLLCDACDDYDNCKSCKENAITLERCICDYNYVLNAETEECMLIEDGYFRDENGLEQQCPILCQNCLSEKLCTSCDSYSSIIDGVCQCIDGYLLNSTKCILSEFEASLEVNKDNTLFLVFTDELENDLDKQYIEIIVLEDKISFGIEQYDKSSYFISLSIKTYVKKDTEITLRFLDRSKLKSKKNGILPSEEIYGSLNSYDPDPLTGPMSAMASQTSTSVQSAVAASFVLTFINPNPSALWSLLNTLSVLTYLCLSSIPISHRMKSFLLNMNQLDVVPNPFEYLIDPSSGKVPYKKAAEFGFETDLILLNVGKIFATFMIFICAYPVVMFFSKCSSRDLGKKFTEILKSYKYALFIRFWVQAYLDIGVAAIIGLLSVIYIQISTDGTERIVNTCICITCLIIVLITPFILLIFSYKNKQNIISSDRQFSLMWSSFFYEFRNNKGLLSTQFYMVFFVRRLIYMLSLIFLNDHPQTQITINVVLSVTNIIFLILMWPFRDSILQVINTITEIGIGIFMILTCIYVIDIDESTVQEIEQIMIGTLALIIGIQTLGSVLIVVRTTYEFLKNKYVKNPRGRFREKIHSTDPKIVIK